MQVYPYGRDVSGTFQPQYRFITSITRNQTTNIGFGQAHDFTDGEIVSFRVSKPSGTVELNNVETRVISHDSTSITVGIASQNFTPYVNAGQYIEHPAVCVPSSSGVVPGSIPPMTNLRDCFDNVPPI